MCHFILPYTRTHKESAVGNRKTQATAKQENGLLICFNERTGQESPHSVGTAKSAAARNCRNEAKTALN
jgi:hypothetical protein